MKKTPKSAFSTVPPMEYALDTFAYHVEGLSDRPRDEKNAKSFSVKMGMGGFGPGCPLVIADVVITPAGGDETDQWGHWAQTTVNGKQTGNRSGARKEYARLCAPVFQWLAEHHAAAAAKKAG